MHAAKGLFEEYGPDGVTFSQIADAADVCRTTVFNHFSGTRELLLALVCQEISDITEFCGERDLKGKDLVFALFDKLIEDTALYPALTGRLINNAVLSSGKENPVTIIEKLTAKGLIQAGVCGEDIERKVIAVEGTYFGLVNHYHINNKVFDAEVMKKEFHSLLEDRI